MILVFDTAAEHCAVTLWCDGVCLSETAEVMARGHAERLFPMIDEVLAAAGASFQDITRIGVSTGPGNFTGVRVGVAAARGLSLSLGAPAIGVDRFETAISPDFTGCIRIPARGGASHLARFVLGERSGDAATLDAEEAARFVADAAVITPAITDLAALARIVASRDARTEERPRPRYLKPTNAALPEAPPLPILP